MLFILPNYISPLSEVTKLTYDYYITLWLEVHYAIKCQNQDNKEGWWVMNGRELDSSSNVVRGSSAPLKCFKFCIQNYIEPQVHIYNPRILELEVEGSKPSGSQHCPQLHRKGVGVTVEFDYSKKRDSQIFSLIGKKILSISTYKTQSPTYRKFWTSGRFERPNYFALIIFHWWALHFYFKLLNCFTFNGNDKM